MRKLLGIGAVCAVLAWAGAGLASEGARPASPSEKSCSSGHSGDHNPHCTGSKKKDQRNEDRKKASSGGQQASPGQPSPSDPDPLVAVTIEGDGNQVEACEDTNGSGDSCGSVTVSPPAVPTVPALPPPGPAPRVPDLPSVPVAPVPDVEPPAAPAVPDVPDPGSPPGGAVVCVDPSASSGLCFYVPPELPATPSV